MKIYDTLIKGCRLTQTNKGEPAYDEIKNYINSILKLTNVQK